MTPDRLLRSLHRLAEHMAKTGSRRQSRRAVRAYRLIGALRHRAASDVRNGALIRDTLRVVALLRTGSAARQAPPEVAARVVVVTDAEITAALQATDSINAAAERLGVNRKTISRRVSKLMGQAANGVPLGSLVSLQRSTARRNARRT